MSWDTWDLAPDLLGGELPSSPVAQLTFLHDETLSKGPYTISTEADYAAGTASWPLTEDMLFSPGKNVVWLQNFNVDFFWCIIRDPAVALPAAVQPSSQTRFRITVYKMVGWHYKRDTRIWFNTVAPHCEAYDQHTLFSNGLFSVHAGKVWSMRSVVFDCTGNMLMAEFNHRGMANHMMKMETWPLHLQQQLEFKLGRR